MQNYENNQKKVSEEIQADFGLVSGFCTSVVGRPIHHYHLHGVNDGGEAAFLNETLTSL